MHYASFIYQEEKFVFSEIYCWQNLPNAAEIRAYLFNLIRIPSYSIINNISQVHVEEGARHENEKRPIRLECNIFA